MTKEQSAPNEDKKDTKNKRPSKRLSPPPDGSPMDKFNKAMRKILSVPKKNIKK